MAKNQLTIFMVAGQQITLGGTTKPAQADTIVAIWGKKMIDEHTEKKFDLLFYALQIIDICAFLGTGIAISMAIHPAIENEGLRTLANLAVGWAMGSALLTVLSNRSRIMRG